MRPLIRSIGVVSLVVNTVSCSLETAPLEDGVEGSIVLGPTASATEMFRERASHDLVFRGAVLEGDESVTRDFTLRSDGDDLLLGTGAGEQFIELMRISSDGTVAIGTASPQAALDVAGVVHARASSSGSVAIRALNTNDTRVVDIGNQMDDHGNVRVFASDGSTEAVRLSGVPDGASWVNNGGGNFGVGTTGPERPLHVKMGDSGANTVGFSDTGLVVESASSAAVQLLGPAASIQHIYFGTPDNGQAGFIEYDHNEGTMALATGAGDRRVSISASGQVGISNLTPTETLDVGGTCRISSLSGAGTAFVCVDAAGTLFRSDIACN